MNLISICDIMVKELEEIIRNTKKIKASPRRYKNSLSGKILAMIFEKPSTRTRISFDVAMLQLGGHAIVLKKSDMQLGRGESIGDSARVLSSYVDGVMARVNKHETLVELARNSKIPVINGLSDIEHPCQIISDLFTINEVMGRLKGINIAYVGDGNNVCNSLIPGCAMLGINLTIASPRGYEPSKKILNQGIRISRKLKSRIRIVTDPKTAVRDAEVVYTDVWVSMGDEVGYKRRLNAFRGYQINKKLLSFARPNCKVMHCLPAHRGLEITDDVIDGPNSIVWIQAENRLHTQKAILVKLLNEISVYSSYKSKIILG